jgi:hypothetical protein
MEAAAAAAAVAAAAVAGVHPISLMGHSSDDGSLQQGQARQGRRSIIEDSAVSWGLRRGADGSSEPLDVSQVRTCVRLGVALPGGGAGCVTAASARDICADEQSAHHAAAQLLCLPWCGARLLCCAVTVVASRAPRTGTWSMMLPRACSAHRQQCILTRHHQRRSYSQAHLTGNHCHCCRQASIPHWDATAAHVLLTCVFAVPP